jgi:hypothetical protein
MNNIRCAGPCHVCDAQQRIKEAVKQDPNILQEADQLTSKDRVSDYGHPRENLGQTAELWTAYLRGRTTITARDVCWMMVLVKASRDYFKPKRDNLVDGCGYLRCAERLDEPQ